MMCLLVLAILGFGAVLLLSRSRFSRGPSKSNGGGDAWTGDGGHHGGGHHSGGGDGGGGHHGG
jgi:hypothetical protein